MGAMGIVQARPRGCADIVEANLPALRALCRRFGVRRLDLFGSAANGRFDPARSDLDFLVEFEKPSSGGFYGDYFKLLEALETLFQRKVDLLKETSLVNPYLRRQIESEKRRIFPPQ
jgi:predicted nucleotidyltransferase